jgi:hypothetical protein
VKASINFKFSKYCHVYVSFISSTNAFVSVFWLLLEMHDVPPVKVSNMKCKLHSIFKSFIMYHAKYIVLNVV